MVTDYPKNLDEFGKFLDSLEGPMHRQIMIEAKIIRSYFGQGFEGRC